MQREYPSVDGVIVLFVPVRLEESFTDITASFSTKRQRLLRCTTCQAVTYPTHVKLTTQHEVIPQVHLKG
jgi:hypothetical protein